MQYNNPIPVAISIIQTVKDGKLGYLGIVRNIEPSIGGIALPGGYIDEYESVREAAKRELLEEVGFQIEDSNDFQFVHETTNHKNQLILFFKYNKVVDWENIIKAYNQQKNNEIQNIVFIDENTELCFPIHKEVIVKLFNE